jgi:hypothetical protein
MTYEGVRLEAGDRGEGLLGPSGADSRVRAKLGDDLRSLSLQLRRTSEDSNSCSLSLLATTEATQP